MTEQTEAPREDVQVDAAQEQPAAQPAPEPAVEPAETPVVDAKDVEDGKVFAILSYGLFFVGLPFFLVPLIMRNNTFSLYHAKQCLLIWLALLATSVVNVIPCLGQLVWLGIAIFLIVLNIMGLINAIRGETKPVPLIGKWAEDWFKGIAKA